MYDIQKMRLFNEVFSRTLPQSVDYDSHSGQYRIELSSVRPIYADCNESRGFVVSGKLEKNTITAVLATDRKELCSITDLPYIANEGDRTPIYKIVRASVLFAYGTLRLADLHKALKKIPAANYPIASKDRKEQTKHETDFMKKLSTVYRDKQKCIESQATLIHPASSRLKEVISSYDKEEKSAIRKTIEESIKKLTPFAPCKEDAENAVPDVFVWDYEPDYPKEKFDIEAIVLNTSGNSKKRFWWDYLKLNLYLDCVEYSFAYYLLMNRWKTATIQKWIAEYRAQGLFESQRAKDYMVIYLKATEKSSAHILNSQGNVAKVKLR